MEYEINSLADIAKLEDDQIDRLCAELPSVIKQVKAVTDLINAVGDVSGTNSAAEFLSPMIWIDDGKRDITVGIVSNKTGEELLTYKKTCDEGKR